MVNFNYRKAKSAGEASPDFRILAGGTTLIDLMKLEVENPKSVLDINGLPLRDIKPAEGGGLFIGALATNAAVANNELVKKNYPVLSEAILHGASAQLRNKATTAGNLLQRTRCVYFRDPSKPCNKREPKSGCPAMEGHNRNLAIMGTSDACIASNPSDMNVAMMALGAKIHIESGGNKREVDITDFYLTPGNSPEKEFNLAPGEIITGVTLAPLPAGTKSYYLKLRDRASYEFALASAATVLTVKSGVIERARFAMGGIGTVPWRVPEAEKMLEGKKPEASVFRLAAEQVLKGAKPRSENAFKVELAKRCLLQALKTVTA